MVIDLMPGLPDNSDSDKNARNQAAFIDIQQTVAEQFRYAAAVHIPVAWLVSSCVTLACRGFFKDSHDVSQLNSWLAYLMPAVSGAATLVVTKSGIEDLWRQPNAMHALIQTKKSKIDVIGRDVDVYIDDPSRQQSGESGGQGYVISYPGTPVSTGSSEEGNCPTGRDEESQLPHDARLQGLRFHTVNSEPSLSEPLLFPRVNYTLVAQLADRAVWQQPRYNAGMMMVVATVLFVGLSLSDDLTPQRFDFGQGEHLDAAVSCTAQVLVRGSSGMLLPTVLNQLGIKLSDPWSLITGLTVASLVGWRAIMAVVDSQQSISPYVCTVLNTAQMLLVAVGTAALDKHYQGQPSATLAHGLNALGSGIGQGLKYCVSCLSATTQAQPT